MVRYSILIWISLFLDPRFKLSIVDGVITELGHYLGRDYTSYLTDFKHKLDMLFSLYENRYNGSRSGSGSGTSRRGDQDLDVAPPQGSSKWAYVGRGSSSSSYIHRPNEMTRYLQVDLTFMTMKEQLDMNILQWWNHQENRFPIISQIARDILSVPVSTIASESTFSTSGQII